MKKLLALLGTLVVLGALIVCFGCNKQEPVAQQPTIIRQDAETAKMAQAKTDALQEFQRFRLASTYRDGERYQISLLLALGRANLKPEDINTSGAELSAHVWDLSQRKRPSAKPVRPVMAQNKTKKQNRR